MSLQIDPTSVHLGKNAGVIDNIYVANYFGVPDATGICKLPDTIDYTPGNPALLPLQPSCTFNFTNVLGVPPLPPAPPPVTFRGCETLSASTSITALNAAKNTTFSLVAGGPYPGDTGTEDCTLKLIGVVDVPACENFTASSNVIFGSAAAGSTLTVAATGIPNCGFTLNGNVNITACESFTATQNITFGSALKGSYLTVTPSSQPNCGIDISGYINGNACENFNASSNVSFTGAAVKKSSFSVSPTSAPNCGFTLNGDVVIDACTDFTATGGINFSGAAVKSSSVKVTAAQQPNCGLVLSGDVVIDACATFRAENNLRITGSAVTWYTPLSIVSIGTPDCGFTLNGDLSIDACASASVNIVPDNTNPSSITLYVNVPEGQTADKGEPFSAAQLILRSAQVSQSGCDSTISLTMDPIDLALPSGCCPTVKPYTPGTTTGCCWEEANGPYLYKDEYKDEIYIAGLLPEPCFVCDTAGFKDGSGAVIPFVYGDIKLNSLEVNYLSGSECCASRSDNNLNLCDGNLAFTDPVSSTQLYAMSTQILLTANTGVTTKIAAGDVSLYQAGSTAELEPLSLTIDNTNFTNTYLYATSDNLSYSDSLANTADLSARRLYLADCSNNYSYVGTNVFETGNDAGGLAQISPTYIVVQDGTYGQCSLSSISPNGFVTTNTRTNEAFNVGPNYLYIGTSSNNFYVDVNSYTSKSTAYATDFIATGNVVASYVGASTMYADTSIFSPAVSGNTVSGTTVSGTTVSGNTVQAGTLKVWDGVNNAYTTLQWTTITLCGAGGTTMTCKVLTGPAI